MNFYYLLHYFII